MTDKLAKERLDELELEAARAMVGREMVEVAPVILLALIAAARRLESATAHHDEHHARDDERWAKAQAALGLQAAWPALFDRMRELVAAKAQLALYRCGDVDPASGAECTRLKGHLSESHWDAAGHRWGVALVPPSEAAPPAVPQARTEVEHVHDSLTMADRETCGPCSPRPVAASPIPPRIHETP